MPKLHELLAVEGDLKGRAQQAKNTVIKLFTEGSGRLLGRVITYQVDEGEDPRPSEITELATTTPAELDQFQMAYSQWLDAAIQKEVTNQATLATVTVDDIDVFRVALPATALLNLESKLTELRTVYAAIPTLDPTERWEWDDGLGYYISKDRVTNITKKVPNVLILYEATPEHPAQVQAFNEDVKVGTRTTMLQSGMVSFQDKAKIINRIDKLLRAVKEARQRANDVDITNTKVAEAIFNYIRE